MWPSTGLGPPTYRPFDFPYDEYRGGMGEFTTLGAAPATWGAPPPTQTVVSPAHDDRANEDSVSFIVPRFEALL